MDPVTAAMALAQFVPQIIKWVTGSDKAEQVSEKVIEIAKTVTGTGNAEEAVAQLKADPSKVLEFRKACLDQEVEIVKQEVKVIETVNESIRTEAAADHWPTYSWRPFIGFSFGAYINSLWLLPLFTVTPVIMSPDTVLAVGAILGVASWYRGKMQAESQIKSDNRG